MSGKRAHVDRAAGDRPTLSEETRSVAQARIVQGAATALATRGFDATVDDIAATAGVGRRTVFRYFATHDDVVDAAVTEILARYDSLIPGPPSPSVDLETWLRETALTMHDLNGRLMGRAFWDMNVERPGITPAERDRRRVGVCGAVGPLCVGPCGRRRASTIVGGGRLRSSAFRLCYQLSRRSQRREDSEGKRPHPDRGPHIRTGRRTRLTRVVALVADPRPRGPQGHTSSTRPRNTGRNGRSSVRDVWRQCPP